jgi:hypothetical protein
MVIDWLKKLTRASATPGRPADRDAVASEAPVSQDRIARRAYEKWVARGRPAGTATQDWLEAEAELRAERKANNSR